MPFFLPVYRPDVALIEGHVFVATWRDGNGVRVAQGTAAAGFGPPFTPGPNPVVSQPRVYGNSRGDAIVVWESDDTLLNVAVRRPRRGFGSALRIDPALLGLDHRGNLIAVSGPPGSFPFTFDRKAVMGPSDSDFGPTRAIPAQQGISWAGFDALGNLVLMSTVDDVTTVQMADRDGSYGPRGRLSPEGSGAPVGPPGVQVDATGDAIATWYVGRGPGALWYATYDMEEFERQATPVVSSFRLTRGVAGDARSARRAGHLPAFRYRLSKRARVRIQIQRPRRERVGSCHRTGRHRFLCRIGLIVRRGRLGRNIATIGPRLKRLIQDRLGVRATIEATDPAGRTSRRRSIRLIPARP
jgi:hypothetical protein